MINFQSRLLCTILFPLTVLAVEKSSVSRFHHILRHYDNPRYTACDRDLVMGFSYSGTEHRSPPRSITIDTGGNLKQNYSMKLRGNTGVLTRYEYSSVPLQVNYTVNSDANVVRNRNTTISGNEALGTFDSTIWNNSSIGATLKGSGSLRYYPAALFFQSHLFLEIGGYGDLTGAYNLQNNYSHDIGSSVERTYAQSATRRNFSASVHFFPAVGFGKKQPVEPVYKAFEMERKLRKDGVLKGNLSNGTLLQLSEMVGSGSFFRVSHERPDKFMMQKFESILRGDSACDSTALDSYALFHAYETFSEQFPWLFHGFEIKLRLTGMAEYIYDDVQHGTELDTHYVTSFDYTAKSPLQLAWTLPLASRLFLSLGIDPPVPGPRKTFEAMGMIGATFLVTNRIVAKAGFSEIPVYLIAPNGKPGLFECSVYFYLEDHITLDLHISRQFSGYSGWSTERDYRYNVSEGISGQIRYDF